ncbi:hypothetical protein L249_4497 [Ophiocordyceps polyrhachis-furcata BCC 54312]|uniref:Uncharacterized protein n=1 Tax=Ophiocordyceps polyrhachis-furcata BCC 54312 TaxID=1330021 RepID=A0A367KZ16_9HYPO|nr:hypothetical protein L249_4497 [Ophiocordyceps polyrhachis-furcata BCC 54312]
MITLRWIILPPYNEGVHAAYSRSSFIIESDCTFEQRYLQLPTVFNQDVIDPTADTVGCCWEEQISPGGKFTHDDLPCPPLNKQ